MNEIYASFYLRCVSKNSRRGRRDFFWLRPACRRCRIVRISRRRSFTVKVIGGYRHRRFHFLLVVIVVVVVVPRQFFPSFCAACVRVRVFCVVSPLYPLAAILFGYLADPALCPLLPPPPHRPDQLHSIGLPPLVSHRVGTPLRVPLSSPVRTLATLPYSSSQRRLVLRIPRSRRERRFCLPAASLPDGVFRWYSVGVCMCARLYARHFRKICSPRES